MPLFKLDLEKAEEPESKLPTSAGSSEKQENSRKTSTSALLTTPKPLTVWITTNCKILQEMGIPDHLTCLLRNLYAGQEATVRTGHGTTYRNGTISMLYVLSKLFSCIPFSFISPLPDFQPTLLCSSLPIANTRNQPDMQSFKFISIF